MGLLPFLVIWKTIFVVANLSLGSVAIILDLWAYIDARFDKA
jgi:hypothetical protein